MQNYNVLAQKFALLALTSLMTVGMTACTIPKSSPSTNSSDAGGATFTVSSMQADFTSTKTEPSFAVPVSKTLSFKACVNDIQYSKAIMGHKFLITSDSEQVETTSDNSGCMVWQEEIPYNHIANSKYVQIDRTMIAKGFQKGSRVISFAINPWEGKALSLKDNKVQNLVSADQAQVHLKGNGDTKPLWLQNPVVNVQQKEFASNRTVYSIEFLAEPKFITKNNENETVLASIYGGQYDLQLFIFRTKLGAQGKSRELIAQPQVESIDGLRFGKISKTFNVNLPGNCSMSRYELGVKVTPKNTSLALAPFNGVFDLGACEDIVGNGKSLTFKDDLRQLAEKGQFSLEKYVSEAPQAAATGEGIQQSSIQIQTVKAVFPISYITRSVYDKTRHFGLTFCVTSGNVPLRFHKLKVTGINKEIHNVDTDGTGCVQNALDSYPFNYFAKECWAKTSITVESDSLGFREEIPLIINTVYEFGNFVTDLRSNLSNPIAGTCATGDSKLTAETYAWDKVGYFHDIDPYLGLTVHKKGTFRLSVKVNRPVITDGAGATSLNLPVGQYKLRWAVTDSRIKDYKKEAAGKIYAAGEQIVQLNANSVIQIDNFDIPMTNIKAIGNTNHILFEVSPIGNEAISTLSGLKIFPFRAPINVQNNSEGNTIFPQEDLGPIVESLINQYKVDQERIIADAKKLATKEFFAKDTGITLLNLNDANAETQNKITKIGLDKPEIQNWIKTGETSQVLAKKLCSHWMNDVLSDLTKKTIDFIGDKSLMAECIEAVEKNPREFFDIEFRYFLDNPTKVVEYGASPRDLSVSQGFSLSNSSSINESTSLSADAGLSLSGKGGEAPFSASLGVRYAMSLSWTNSQSFSNSIGINSGFSATVETIPISIQATDYEKCVVVKMNPSQIVDPQQNAYSENTWGTKISKFVHNNFHLSMLQRMGSKISNEMKYKLTSKGYMICNGVKEGKKLPSNFVENFYIINQKQTVTQGSDNASDATREFFVSLRGRGDLVSFISMTQGSLGFPESFKEDYLQSHLLLDSSMQAFKHGLRTYPGQIVAPK